MIKNMEFRSRDGCRVLAKVSIDRGSDVIKVAISGVFTLTVVDSIRDEINECLTLGEKLFIFDLAETTYIDSTGLNFFMVLKEELEEVAGTVRITGLTGTPKEVFIQNQLYEDFCEME